MVFDDPEIDEFLHVLPEQLYNCIGSLQEQQPDWRYLKRFERVDLYRDNGQLLFARGVHGFEEFNALMRLDLGNFEHFAVDYNRIPYGQDNPSAKGIYRGRDGKVFYIGVKPWVAEIRGIRSTFLTTEDTVTRT